ncbi:hypothetical protein [Paenibacillus dendritiformis]|uniref:hypothetical protein n=1 Tax=Paenibacillus dendritiformis TaxID=130049 RepID=UPI001BCC3BE4|nr:hypothetical protein [Paenibacillus dendritiformis]
MSCSFAAQLAAAGEPIAPNRRFRKNNQERELQLPAQLAPPACRSRRTGASGRTTRSVSCSFAAQLAAAGVPIAPNRRFRKNNQERELQLPAQLAPPACRSRRTGASGIRSISLQLYFPSLILYF